MKTYTYEDREYVESGEIRLPKRGELIPSVEGKAWRVGFDYAKDKYPILIPKEISMDSEYQIPVLVKADADSGWSEQPKFLASVRGRVILCRHHSGTYDGPLNADAHGEFSRGFVPNWLNKDIIPWPTQAQVEEEQAKLKPKADPLPSPVREALQAADLGCRREGVEKLIEAIYANPPTFEGR